MPGFPRAARSIRDFPLASLRQFALWIPRSWAPALLCMIYGRSYQKSGYWNFNIRYNRPTHSTVATTAILILLRPAAATQYSRSSSSESARIFLPVFQKTKRAKRDPLVARNLYISISISEVNSIRIVVLLTLLRIL